MDRDTLERDWQKLENHINQFVHRLLNENLPIEKRPDFQSQSRYKKDETQDFQEN